MAKVVFEIEDELTPESGIALIRCIGLDGEPVIAEADYGRLIPVDAIGMLQTSLDQYRYDFVDKDGRTTKRKTRAPTGEDERR